MRLLRWLTWPVRAVGRWFGGGRGSVTGEDIRRVGILLLVCALCALCVIDYARAPQDALHAADIAPRTVNAPFEFTYADYAAHEAARTAAREGAAPVYVHRADLLKDRLARIRDAFCRWAQRTGGAHRSG